MSENKILRDKCNKSEVKLLSRVRLFVTLWTVADQAPPNMGFSRQKYCSGLPFPSPGDLPYPGIKPASPVLADGFSTWGIPGTGEPGGLPSMGSHRIVHD